MADCLGFLGGFVCLWSLRNFILTSLILAFAQLVRLSAEQISLEQSLFCSCPLVWSGVQEG